MKEMDRWNAAEDRERLDRYQQESRFEIRKRWEDERVDTLLDDLRNDKDDTPWYGPSQDPSKKTQIKLRRDCACWIVDSGRDDMVEKLMDGSEKGREFIWTAYAMARAEAEADAKDF